MAGLSDIFSQISKKLGKGYSTPKTTPATDSLSTLGINLPTAQSTQVMPPLEPVLFRPPFAKEAKPSELAKTFPLNVLMETGSRLLELVPKAILQTVQNFREVPAGGKATPLVVPFDPKRLGFEGDIESTGKKLFDEFNKRVKEKQPITTFDIAKIASMSVFKTVIPDAFDVFVAGDIITQGANVILKATSFNPELDSALTKLGLQRQFTFAEFKNRFTTTAQDLAAKGDAAGLNELGKATQTVAKGYLKGETAFKLNSFGQQIQNIANELVKPMGETVAKAVPLTGVGKELPGTALVGEPMPSVGLQIQPVKKVTGVPEVPKLNVKIPSKNIEQIGEYKLDKEFSSVGDGGEIFSDVRMIKPKDFEGRQFFVDRNLVDSYKKKILAGEPIEPIIIKQGAVIDGYHRIQALGELGYKEMPAVFVEEDLANAKKLWAKDYPNHPFPIKDYLRDIQSTKYPKYKPQLLAQGVKAQGVKAEVAPTKPPVPPSPPVQESPQMAGKPKEDPINKLNELLKQAKPLRGKLETIYTAERAKRISEVERVINEVGGEEGYKMALGKLKGELAPPEAKIVFEPIKEKLTKQELDSLYDRTFKHPYLDEWEKISAANELTKLLSGELPTPKGLVLLEEIYGTDLIKNILTKRSLGLKVTDFLIDLANLPRAFLASSDMSGFLRQGIINVVAHPLISLEAMKETFKFAFSPKAFKQYFEDLPKDKLYPLMRKSGLAITDPTKAMASGREEVFISRLAQQIPIIGHILRFSERSYVGFLNKLRVDIFKNWADELISKGFDQTKDINLFRAIADVVNTFTGRGSLGTLNRITPALNNIFFSPRLIAARFNALNPIWYAKMPKEIRMKAISDFAKFVAAGLTLLAVIKASGLGEVEPDTRSSDSGKIKIGDTRWDIWAGFQQWVRVFSQIITGERKSADGEIISLNKEEYPFTTRKEVILRFIEGKLAPVPALINELISGAKTFTGEDLTFETVAKEKFIPMYIQDIADAYASGGLGRAIGAGVPAFFGVGVQTYENKPQSTFKVKDYTKSSSGGGFKVKNYAK